MSHQPGSWKIRLLLLVAAVVSACGGGDICLQCPDGSPTPGTSGVTITGTIVSSNPATAPSSITAIVCVGLEQGQSVTDCPNSFYADVNTDGTFTRRNVKDGAETIFFWVDSDGSGMINPDGGDLIAQLQDGEGILDRVQNGQTVTLSDVRIAFLSNTATANITIGQTPTPTPTAVTTTPTPQNT